MKKLIIIFLIIIPSALARGQVIPNSSGGSGTSTTAITDGYIGFTLGTTFTGTFPATLDGMLAQEGPSILAQRGGTNAEFLWYASKTNTTNYTNVRLTTGLAAGYSTFSTRTLTAGSNATSAGLCLQTNNNTANRWCVGAATGNAGSLMQGATPNIIYGITTPTITSGFGTSPSIAGKASSFKITIGSGGATTGVVAFAITFTNAPSCQANDETVSNYIQSVPTTTGVTLNGTMTAADVVSVICLGY